MAPFLPGWDSLPTPFPLNILPIFPVVWLVIGWLYTAYLLKTNPTRFAHLGRIVRGEDDLKVVEEAEAMPAASP